MTDTDADLARYINPRFLKHLDLHAPTGCWIWHGSCDDDGYGRFKVGPRTVHAHRYAFEQVFGPIPTGKVLRHTCHCRQCCNPEHVIPGTHQENIADRQARGSTARGERNGRACLTTDQVIVIRDRLAQGETPYRIAKDYPVSARAIAHIRDGRTWAEPVPTASSCCAEGALTGAQSPELRTAQSLPA